MTCRPNYSPGVTPTKGKEADAFFVASVQKVVKKFINEANDEERARIRTKWQPLVDETLVEMSSLVTPDKVHRTQRPQNRTVFPKKKKRKAQQSEVDATVGTGTPGFIENVLQPCLRDSSGRGKPWHSLVAMEAAGELNYAVVEEVGAMSQEDKLAFQEGMKKAQIVWSCKKCKEVPLDKLEEGFFTCLWCDGSFHASCVAESGQPTALWLCPTCRTVPQAPNLQDFEIVVELTE